MQLTKLRAAPVLRAEVPPCAPAGRTDGGTASQLIRSVGRTLACRSDMTKLLAATLLAAVSLLECERKPTGPTPVGVTRTHLTVLGAVFDVPHGCVAQCRWGFEAYTTGALACYGLPGVVRYGAGVELGDLPRPPLGRFGRSVEGSDRLGDAVVYWGSTEREPVQFCAVVTFPVVGFGSPQAFHSFCTDSQDPRLRGAAVSVARSFRRAAESAPETCGLPIQLTIQR